jgi:hypothetical protein
MQKRIGVCLGGIDDLIVGHEHPVWPKEILTCSQIYVSVVLAQEK